MIELFLCNISDKKIVNKKNRLFYNLSNCITLQIEHYRVNWIIPMKEIPAEIRVIYDALMVQNKTPEKLHFYYRKWLRHNSPKTFQSCRGCGPGNCKAPVC